MQIVSNVALISINETMVVQLISFLIFLFVINRVMFRPLRNPCRSGSTISKVSGWTSRTLKKNSRRPCRQPRDEDAAVRKAGLQMTAELEKQGNEEAGKIIAAARQEIAQRGNKARQEIDAQIADARKTIVAEADKLSVSVMEKVLGRRLVS